jgi:hypothetical protein
LVTSLAIAAGCGGQEQGATAPPKVSATAGADAGGTGGSGGTADGGSTAGATAPGTGDTPTSGTAVGGPGPSGSGTGVEADPGTSPSPSARPAGPLDLVNAYYAAINSASQSGTVADVSAIALDGCQTCALDVGVTRQLAGGGDHTDGPPYAVSGLSLASDNGLAATASLTVTMRAYRELDAHGATVTTTPAGGRRTGTVTVTLTPAGWRLQNILYSTGE